MKILPSWSIAFQLCATTCVLTLNLWLFHHFTKSSFHWQLSPLSSLLSSVSHAFFSSIGWSHFPHLLLPMFLIPIFPLQSFTKILCQLQCSLALAKPNTHSASFQQTNQEEAKARPGMAIQMHEQNTQNWHIWVSEYHFGHRNKRALVIMRNSGFGSVGEWHLVRTFQVQLYFHFWKKGAEKGTWIA